MLGERVFEPGATKIIAGWFPGTGRGEQEVLDWTRMVILETGSPALENREGQPASLR